VSRKISANDEITAAGVYCFKNKLEDTGRGDLLSHLGKGTELETGGFSFALGYTHYF